MSAIRFFSTIADSTEEVRVTAGWSSRRGVFYMDVQTVGKDPVDLLRISLLKGQETSHLVHVLRSSFDIRAPIGFWERVGLRKAEDDYEFKTISTAPGQVLCSWCKDSALIPGIIFPIASDGDNTHAYVERCDECELVADDLAAAFILSHYLKKPVVFGRHGRPYIEGISFDSALKLRPQPFKFP